MRVRSIVENEDNYKYCQAKKKEEMRVKLEIISWKQTYLFDSIWNLFV